MHPWSRTLGTGGFTRVLSLIETVHTVVYNTLVIPSDYVTQMDPIQNIPDISDLPLSKRKKVIGLRKVNDFPSDITTGSYPDFFVEHFGTEFDILTGDSEDPALYEIAHVLKLFLAYRNIFAHARTKWGVFKIHARVYLSLRYAVEILLTYFDGLYVMRSAYSLSSNTELYLVCYKLKDLTPIIPVHMKILDNGECSKNIYLKHEARVELESLVDKLLISF